MNRIPVFYSEKMLADQGAETFSPSSGKPRHVLASWQTNHPGMLDVRDVTPATVAELCRAHVPEFVTGVLACERLNGFGNTLKIVADSLPYTSGAMLSAAWDALATGQVAVAPTSGFHHAGWNKPEGFCTFNGLMVTALALREKGFRVGILDIDQHYGNGTDDIIKRLRLQGLIPHYTVGKFNYQPREAASWLASLGQTVRHIAQGCDIVLYQAGADPHVDDPYGGFLTTEQLHERDRIVFGVLREMGIPVVWNLAGGYQSPLRKVLDIHDNTMRACIAEYLTEVLK